MSPRTRSQCLWHMDLIALEHVESSRPGMEPICSHCQVISSITIPGKFKLSMSREIKIFQINKNQENLFTVNE